MAHLQFFQTHIAKQKTAKEPPSQRTKKTQMTTNKDDKKEGRSANTRLASCGVTWVNSSSFFQLGFSAGLTVLCSEIPHERQAWER